MKKRIVTLAMAVLIFWPVNAVAEKLVIATALWPPYLMMENGQPTGVDIEIAKELCKRLGLDPEFQVLPWKRALKYMKDGKADALLTPRHTEEREKFMYYPSESIHIEKSVLMVRKGSDIKVTQLDDLKGERVGIVRGYAYGSEFDNHPDIKRQDCDDDNQLVKVFARKRVSIIAGAEEGSMKYLCKKAGIEAKVAYVLSGVPSYIGFSKKANGEKGKALAEKFAKALRQLKAEGFIKKTESKYF